MKQFKTILKYELKSYFANKIFVGITVFLVLVTAVVMFFPRISEMLDKNEDLAVNETQDNQNEYVDITETEKDLPIMLLSANENADALSEAFKAAFPDYTLTAVSDNAEILKEKITSGEAECAFYIESLTKYTYYVGNLSLYDSNQMIADETLQSLYRMNAMIENGVSAENASTILSTVIESRTENLGVDQVNNFFYTYIMIFALYMVILLYGQMVATNVATEKSSRAMEVLITSAKPVSMMFGKVIASCLAGFIQLSLVFGSAVLFFTLNRKYWDTDGIVASIFNIPPYLLLYMLIFFVLGFFIYAFMFGAVGSTASKLEDINTSVMPITLIFVFAFIVVMFSMAGDSVDSLLMRVCSYIPFTSPMAMFTRIAMSSVPLYEIIISIAVLIVSVIAVGIVSAKIYRIGVLLYGTPPKISAIIKAIKKA